MLKNEYLVAKIGFDTAENEPSENLKLGCRTTTGRRPCRLIEFNLEMPTPLSGIVSIAVPGKAAETLRACVDGVLDQ